MVVGVKQGVLFEDQIFSKPAFECEGDSPELAARGESSMVPCTGDGVTLGESGDGRRYWQSTFPAESRSDGVL